MSGRPNAVVSRASTCAVLEPSPVHRLVPNSVLPSGAGAGAGAVEPWLEDGAGLLGDVGSGDIDGSAGWVEGAADGGAGAGLPAGPDQSRASVGPSVPCSLANTAETVPAWLATRANE